MASLNILYSDAHNFLKEVAKKIGKVHEKIFCGLLKILKNISWPINRQGARGSNLNNWGTN